MAASEAWDDRNSPIGIGVMSGTSCDGIDLALCDFSAAPFRLSAFLSLPFPEKLRARLLSVMHLPAREIFLLENEFTAFTAAGIRQLRKLTDARPCYIGAHGHTVFHRPEQRLTFQMLNGGMLAELTGLPVVCDFRRQDVALGGQGAPLVPLGDRLLFGAYDACVNLGGVANVSLMRSDPPAAYDICPANLILNELAQRTGKAYDEGGALAASGRALPALLKTLNALPYYRKPPPKSLGREWFEEEFLPHFSPESASTADLAATAVTHISDQLAASLNGISAGGRVLFSGGGAFNTFLTARIAEKLHCKTETADRQMTEAKEAVIFALLAKLRLEGKSNVINEVTGAEKAVSGGAVYLPS